MHFRFLRRVALVATAVLASPPAHERIGGATVAAAQRARVRDTSATAGAPRPLSLDEAMKIAERQSENLQIARAGVDRRAWPGMQAKSAIPAAAQRFAAIHTHASESVRRLAQYAAAAARP
jgi:hypothetical protein